jgi:hypothetical protein
MQMHMPITPPHISKGLLKQQHISKGLLKQQPISKGLLKQPHISKEPTKRRRISKEPTKLRHISKEIPKPQDISKETPKLWHTSMGHISKEPHRLEHISKEPHKLEHISKEPHKPEDMLTQPLMTPMLTRCMLMHTRAILAIQLQGIHSLVIPARTLHLSIQQPVARLLMAQTCTVRLLARGILLCRFRQAVELLTRDRHHQLPNPYPATYDPTSGAPR